MVNLAVVNTFTKMNPCKFYRFFSQNCAVNNLCFNSDVLDIFFSKISIFSTYLNYYQYAIQMISLCSTSDLSKKTEPLPNAIANIQAIIEVLPLSENLGI